MKTIKKVPVNVVYVDNVPDNIDDNTLYISEKYGVVIHNCLCGCKEESVTPLGQDQWLIETDNSGRITMSPSILNPCKSHYIIRKGVANFV